MSDTKRFTRREFVRATAAAGVAIPYFVSAAALGQAGTPGANDKLHIGLIGCGGMGRGNLGTGKGAAQFSWTSRPILGPLRAHFQLFSGYGESLIDYDWNQTTVGVGVTLNDLL